MSRRPAPGAREERSASIIPAGVRPDSSPGTTSVPEADVPRFLHRRPLALRPGRGAPGSAGFSLVELLISLAVLALALALAAQLLVEAAQMLADAAAEQRDLPAPVALARVRADVRAATAFIVLPPESGKGARLLLAGLPVGDVIYAREGDELVRRIVEPGGKVGEPAPLLDQVTAFHPFYLGPRLVRLDVYYRAHVPRRTPLAVLPGLAGPTARERQETLMLAPRGAGLGKTW